MSHLAPLFPEGTKWSDIVDATYPIQTYTWEELPTRTVNKNQALANQQQQQIFQRQSLPDPEVVDDDFQTFVPQPASTRQPVDGTNLWTSEKEKLPLPPSYSETDNMASVAVAEEAAGGIAKKAEGGKSGISNSGGMIGGIASGLGNVVGSAISGGLNFAAQKNRDSTAQSMQLVRGNQETAMEQLRQQFATATQQQKFQQQSSLMSQEFSNQLSLQNNATQNQLSIYNTMNNNKIGALSQAGLPDYLAYFPGLQVTMPRTTQMLPGGRGYTSKLPGNPTATPFNGSTAQASLGWGAVPGSAAVPGAQN